MSANEPQYKYMQTYISFLRGVNMTGHNSIKMTDLAELYNDLKFNNVTTYIQSGNVIFSCIDDLTATEISSKIEKAILERFDYDVPVMLRTVEEMRSYLSVNPFLTELNFDPSRVAIIFLHERPSEAQINKVVNINYPPDKFKIIENEIYIYCPNGFGRTKLYTNFFEKKMGVTGTARNWKTITTILEILIKS
jgi:uncharacterized protein (DUF1697 family)